MNQKELIQKLSDAFGPSGFEEDVLRVCRDYLSECAPDAAESIGEDFMRNLYIYRKGNTGEKPVLMLDAHGDEVGYIVQAVRENGLIDFLTLGSQAATNLPSSKIWIRNRQGKLISGVVSSKPPHFMTEADKNAPLSIGSLVIDVGARSKKEVMEVFGIGPGCPAVPAVCSEFQEETEVFLGKAFDDRIGCAVVLEALRRLQGETLPVDIVATITSQEEVGERGATAAVQTVNPQIAICVEGAPADDSFMPEYKIQNGLKRGPMLRHFDVCMVTHPRFIRFALDKASELGIEAQEAVRSGGGTNGGVIHNLSGAVPTIVVSVPVRYPHSAHCYTALSDFEKTVELTVHLIRSLSEEVIASF